MTFVTDNAGRIALREPEWMGREIFFHVRSHGHEVPADGFGYRGVRLVPAPGQVSTVRIRRVQVAERLVRLTGEGLYRDSLLLGHPVPEPFRKARGGLAGQDSVLAALYRDRVFWIWGDTSRLGYPLGLFRVAGATSPVPGPDFDPASGIPHEPFVDPSTGFVRAMMPLPERPEGVIWLSGLCVVPDGTGTDRLIARYSRRKGLAEELEQGIAVYRDEAERFDALRELPRDETWRRPDGHPVIVAEGSNRWLMFGTPALTVRVPATLDAVLDPTRYEAFADPDGSGEWAWQRDHPPTDAATEAERVRRGTLPASRARFHPANAENPAERIRLHHGTVRWNPWRSRWILLAGQSGGGPSALGEIWLAEAREPTGPFPVAVRVLTHQRQTFYNVCHHDFLDRDGGRVIHLEGTYTHTFSGNPWRTPRYEYNQILYRIDLADPRLAPARVP
jgi:hypothetical protein